MPIPKNFASPARMSAKERTFSQIQRWIIDGTLQPGEKLIDAELADSLGVSRTPIREAFQLLEVQGLVSTHPGKETKVTEIEKDDIFKMYSTMAALQALAAEVTAKIIVPEQIEQLRLINLEFASAIKSGQAYQAMETDEQFHNLIVEYSDNPYVTSFSASLQIHIRRFKYVFLKQPITATQASVDEHASIIKAFERKDSDCAQALMKQNFIRPMQELQGIL
ncbi:MULTISPECIES: GntR family transcriptional regulator [Paenibacillus]|uniref:GntR family transcriptional regulator n=1 Tax=Paenibacillus TaxID=44249 RepID=UPI00042424F2|nr:MULTISPECIES: GntR family transcriptional regulator [Paenibacillus]KGP82686.1 GntR family transcriptional regulator [Paenibacillus sp. MAEPY1]KGP83214.1 GntR family transcriptional regulator [Paenibacillus sp. MAEPY2]OZQ58541.1 GntR family transcriptional regulator [Paenibacillus taichungensis]HBU82429.1 GntR family transcriptional regulator [Paenibacillus sp.]